MNRREVLTRYRGIDFSSQGLSRVETGYPEKIVQFPSMEVFKTRSDKALNNRVWSHAQSSWPFFGQEAVLDDLTRSLPKLSLPMTLSYNLDSMLFLLYSCFHSPAFLFQTSEVSFTEDEFSSQNCTSGQREEEKDERERPSLQKHVSSHSG